MIDWVSAAPMIRFRDRLAAMAILIGGLANLGAAAERDAVRAGPAFFESRIRPLLVEHCYRCHSTVHGKAEGNLRLDTREAMQRGGDRGPAVVPGHPEKSLLLSAIRRTDPDLQMPPKGDRLPAALIEDVHDWIAQGAVDPRAEGSPAPPTATQVSSDRESRWSHQPLVPPPLPAVRDHAWLRRDLDQFILARLEQAGLQPSPDADPATLLRRLSFDLLGLPPSPDEVDAFRRAIETVGFERAWEAAVDERLASPHFGETWGRHWLDVFRFAESSGKSANITFPHAWRYRDYVLDAVNEDLSFDQWIREQIAGDLLPWETNAERARLLVATGFLAVGPKNLDEANGWQFLADVIDEQIDAVTRAFLASSIACARCHDHKSDPYTMEDYYALAGIFASTQTYFGTRVSPANRVAGDPLPLPRVPAEQIFHPAIPPDRLARIKAELASLRQEKPTTLRDALRIFWRSGAIEGELETVDESGNPIPLAMGVLDRETIVDAPLLERGDIRQPGPPVPRGLPSKRGRVSFSGLPKSPDAVRAHGEANDPTATGAAVDEKTPAAKTTDVTVPVIPPDQSGRRQLAEWLIDSQRPLTARVLVNRIWHHLFGIGLVRTVDDFGATGERPSHPELLDHLAIQCLEDGWSMKRMVRDLVLSRTYRQASGHHEPSFLVDPENRLRWRGTSRRLTGEAIRDAMLVAAGELDRKRPAGSLVARRLGDRPVSIIGLDPRLPPDLDGERHRSVYLPQLRDRLPDALELFDAPESSLVTGVRETTNVPLQALYLMNSEFVQARAEGLARRLMQERDTDVERVRRAYQICFARDPDPTEQQLTLRFLQEPAGVRQDTSELTPNWLALCQALLQTAEFRNLD